MHPGHLFQILWSRGVLKRGRGLIRGGLNIEVNVNKNVTKLYKTKTLINIRYF